MSLQYSLSYRTYKTIHYGGCNIDYVTKAIGNNKEQKRKSQHEDTRFNVENPLQQRDVKTTGASQQNFTISGVFTNVVGYLMMR
jgi:hypothetical protein